MTDYRAFDVTCLIDSFRGLKMRCAISLLSLILVGCSVGHYEYSREAEKRVDMTVTGIPTVLGIGTLGTTIP